MSVRSCLPLPARRRALDDRATQRVRRVCCRRRLARPHASALVWHTPHRSPTSARRVGSAATPSCRRRAHGTCRSRRASTEGCNSLGVAFREPCSSRARHATGRPQRTCRRASRRARGASALRLAPAQPNAAHMKRPTAKSALGRKGAYAAVRRRALRKACPALCRRRRRSEALRRRALPTLSRRSAGWPGLKTPRPTRRTAAARPLHRLFRGRRAD